MSSKQHPLVGLAFHTFAEEEGHRYVQNQGFVLAVLDGGLALVQLFEWVTGGESTQELRRLDSLLAPNAQFYPDIDVMREWFLNHPSEYGWWRKKDVA